MSNRKPVQIVKISLPKCANVHGTAPCTATQTGDDKCYNCLATCNDVANYRQTPDGHLTADLTKANSDAITSSELTRTADLFAAFDVSFPVTPSGTIWEQGGSADQAAYLGITSTNLVFRAGDGTASDSTTTAKIEVAYSAVAGKTLTLYCEIDISADTVNLWAFDPVELSLTLLGTDTAAASITTWAGTDAGAIGQDGGSNIATGEDGGTFNGRITAARFYDSTAAPDMSDSYRLDLYFGRNQAHRPADDIVIFPFITDIQTSGSRINLAGGDKNYEPLGKRAQLGITMTDAPSSDRVVDPYLSDRGYNPMDFGTFWTKFRVRHKYGRQGALVTLYEGYDGDLLADMSSRSYILDRIDFSNVDGVAINCRDILTRSELSKAQAPVASPGKLAADITAAATSFSIVGAVAADYDASGTLRIGDECMTYSSFTEETNGNLTFTISGRGTDSTTAATHSADDAVQLCLRYTAQAPNTILADLLAKYAGVEYQFLNLSDWATETTGYLGAYSLTTLITEPVEVKTLIGELAEQCAFYVYWDERSQHIDMKAIRGLDAQPATLDDDEHLVQGSVTFRERPEQRADQVWFYYNRRDPTKNLDERTNYRNVEVFARENFYATSQIRSVLSRWISSGAMAVQTASRIARRYRDVPLEVSFQLDAKDRSLWIGDTRIIKHRRIVDRNGRPDESRIFIVIEAEDMPLEGKVRYIAMDATLAGYIYVILANSVGDYVGDGTDQFNGAWISNAEGKYSNGDEGARIS